MAYMHMNNHTNLLKVSGLFLYGQQQNRHLSTRLQTMIGFKLTIQKYTVLWLQEVHEVSLHSAGHL